MRRNFIRLVLVSAFFGAFGQLVYSQPSTNVFIQGPTALCVGECGLYQVMMPGGTAPIVLLWTFSNGQLADGNPIEFCGDAPGQYTLYAYGFSTPNQDSFEVSLTVTVTYSLTPTILSTSAACPNDSAAVCEKICAFGTAYYEVEGVPPTSQVDWEVIGAESYTANGTQLSVDWGAPGQGQVTATVGNSSGSLPMQIFCGQQSIENNQPGTATGTAYLKIFDAAFPVSVSITGPNNYFSNTVGVGSTFSVSDLVAGTYTVVVQDANGNTDQCSFNITLNDSDCWISPFPVELGHASNCNACNGFINIQGYGGAGTQLIFLWSNGATTQNLNNLCPGTYTVTVVDNLNCSTSVSFEIACPTSCSGSATLCVDILEEPEAAIGSIPPAVNGIIAICQGQTVYFQNESLAATSYIWDFGDFNTSTQFEPGHAYNPPPVMLQLYVPQLASVE